MVLLVDGKLKGSSGEATEGLVEPLELSSQPKNVLIARSLTTINSNGSVVLQVANVGSRPVKLYRNMKLGTFTPRHPTASSRSA